MCICHIIALQHYCFGSYVHFRLSQFNGFDRSWWSISRKALRTHDNMKRPFFFFYISSYIRKKLINKYRMMMYTEEATTKDMLSHENGILSKFIPKNLVLKWMWSLWKWFPFPEWKKNPRNSVNLNKNWYFNDASYVYSRSFFHKF